MNIHTGNCFECHARYLLDHQEEGYILVHGVVMGRGQLKGYRYLHCWIESLTLDDLVFDMTIGDDEGTLFSKGMYYDLGKIQDRAGLLKRYTAPELLLKIMRWGHWGAWGTDLEIQKEEPIFDIPN